MGSEKCTLSEAFRYAVERYKNCKGFSYNKRTQKAWFHHTLDNSKIYHDGSKQTPRAKKHDWHDLYRAVPRRDGERDVKI